MQADELEEYFKQKLTLLDWQAITNTMHQQGFVLLENFLSETQCNLVKDHYNHPTLYRKTVIMQRYRFGLGEYKYYTYPLPHLIAQLRTHIYPYLVPIANAWFQVLKVNTVFPATHEQLLYQCQQAGQQKATPLILKYGKDGFNTLHQDLYGDVYFPIQLVIFLNQVNVDYRGGEFVLTHQIPRAQSKVNVLQPNQGDLLIFTTQFRPEKGSRGYYRVNMKHGISQVHEGERYTLGIIFHDAVS